MSHWTAYPDNGFLTDGVLMRRCVGWVIDAVLIGLLVWTLW